MERPCKNSEIVWISWHDACNESVRKHVEEVDSCHLATNKNLGWILNENEHRIVLCHGVSDSGEVDVFVIPRNCVCEILPVVKPRGKSTKAGRSRAKGGKHDIADKSDGSEGG